jgi:hypothetical protein
MIDPFSVIIRTIGLPACIVIALLVYYEGIPGASRIPFLSSVPIVGDLTTGRVHSFAADQVRLATADLVASAELTAARSQLAREQALRRIADEAALEARDRAVAALKARTLAERELEARIAADSGSDGATWTEGDIQWLAR